MMARDASGKHMIWARAPGTTAEVGIGYSSLAEAMAEAENLKRIGYKILRIKPITLPKPNS
jgi:hypothetical protein